MPISYTIETATLRDIVTLYRLEHECFERDAWPIWDLVGILTLPNITRLKAVSGGRMVGFVGGDERPSEGVGWIATIGVTAAFRRQGIARALLEACEEQMALPRVRLSVRPSNAYAVHLYHQMGYRTVDIWTRYYSGGEDGLVMEKIR